jgi:predicted phage-related endonuclease
MTNQNDKLKILNLTQGSAEWLEARKLHCTASEAPAMMGESSYKSYRQLLDEKKGKAPEEVSPFKQSIFDKGHAAEDKAREIIEMDLLEKLPNVVGVRTVDGISLLASSDGVGSIVFEHKLWNDTLADNVKNGILEPFYYWQLEQLLLVFGLDTSIFVVSDGTESKMVRMEYHPVPGRKEQLIAGWKQFLVDLEGHEIAAKKEPVIISKVEAFPLIAVTVEGAVVNSNFTDILKAVNNKYALEFDKPLETEADFGDASEMVKVIKKTEEAVKARVVEVRETQISFADFNNIADELVKTLKSLRLNRSNAVKTEKERLKNDIIRIVGEKFKTFLSTQGELIKPAFVSDFYSEAPDFRKVIHGKSSPKSIQDAVDSELANFKAQITERISQAVLSIKAYTDNNGGGKYNHILFNDWIELCKHPAEAVAVMVVKRVTDHEAEEEKKAEASREKIRIEEEEKATAKLEREKQALILKAKKEEAEKQRKERELENEKQKLLDEQNKKIDSEEIASNQIEADIEPAKTAAQEPVDPNKWEQDLKQINKEVDSGGTDPKPVINHKASQLPKDGDKIKVVVELTWDSGRYVYGSGDVFKQGIDNLEIINSK